ncbi:MAG: branched-chain amino acid ABC transporter permease, partial [Actinomycetota bacterium]
IPIISASATGGFLTTQQLEQIMYGLLIVLFLIFEPRGLFGIWVRVRNYFKAWPFSY